MKKNVMLRFWLWIIACAFMGGIVGILCSMNREDLINIAVNISDFLVKNSTLFMLIAVIPLAIAILIFIANKKDIYRDDLSDEEFERLDKKLCMSFSFSNIVVPIVFIFFGISATSIISEKLNSNVFLNLMVMIAIVVIAIIYQSKAVKAMKKLYPEKRGNVFDRNFQNDWYESCDEAEKNIIGQASYTSYKVMSKIFPIIILIMIFASFITLINAITFIIVGVIWIIQILSYTIPAYKIEHGKKAKKQV